MPARNIQAALRGDLLPTFGHEAGGVRKVGQRDGFHFGGDGHLKVQRPSSAATGERQGVDVGVRDMPAIFTEMGGDPIGARGEGHFSRAHGIRIALAARVSHGGNMIDIHAQAEATRHQ